MVSGQGMENPSRQIWATSVSRTALPRDSQRQSSEISSNPNLCNLSPSPKDCAIDGVSPSMPCSISPPLQWNNSPEEVVKLRGAFTAGRRPWSFLFNVDKSTRMAAVVDSCLHCSCHYRLAFSKSVAAIRELRRYRGAAGVPCLTVVPKGSDTWVSRGVYLLPLHCSSDPSGAGV